MLWPMSSIVIRAVDAADVYCPLPPGAGTDSLHTDPVYAHAVTLLPEHIPEVRDCFVHPAWVEEGVYIPQQEPESRADLAERS